MKKQDDNTLAFFVITYANTSRIEHICAKSTGRSSDVWGKTIDSGHEKRYSYPELVCAFFGKEKS